MDSLESQMKLECACTSPGLIIGRRWVAQSFWICVPVWKTEITAICEKAKIRVYDFKHTVQQTPSDSIWCWLSAYIPVRSHFNTAGGRWGQRQRTKQHCWETAHASRKALQGGKGDRKQLTFWSEGNDIEGLSWLAMVGPMVGRNSREDFHTSLLALLLTCGHCVWAYTLGAL